MTGRYYTEILDVLRAAGCQVAENSTTAGWQSRARSSGGFAASPLGVQFHHTASDTTPANDLSYMINGSTDAPVGNLLLDRSGCYWPVAAGASNTIGKGGPATLSRGTVPQDGGNTRTWAIEAANAGTGQSWPQAQIDAYFAGSNALNAFFGNLPADLLTHQFYAPTRKIDPATAAAVQGLWKPRSCTSSQTWNQDDVRAECTRRATTTPIPPPTPEEDEMTDADWKRMQSMIDASVDATAKKVWATTTKDIVTDTDQTMLNLARYTRSDANKATKR